MLYRFYPIFFIFCREREREISTSESSGNTGNIEMAIPIGSSFSHSSFACPASHNNPKFASSTCNFPFTQRNMIYRLNFSTGIISRNSNKLIKRLTTNQILIPYATSEDTNLNLNLNLNPNDIDLLEEEDFSIIDNSIDLATEKRDGKPGFVSFHGNSYRNSEENKEGTYSTVIPDCTTGASTSSTSSISIREVPDVVWFVGPTVLVSFLVLPSLYLRRLLSLVFEDSLLTDFLILFFTEALFYGGVAIFVLLVDSAWRRRKPLQKLSHTILHTTPRFFRISSVLTLVLSLIIPLVTMGMVWPWTGPAASATLSPYLVGLVVQFAFEQFAKRKNSPSWPVIPVIFKVYRLHQLNRAAQLVTALTFSVRGAESTPQTIAIINSLGVLLVILQILGVICIWSLSSFLMRFFPLSSISLTNKNETPSQS